MVVCDLGVCQEVAAFQVHVRHKGGSFRIKPIIEFRGGLTVISLLFHSLWFLDGALLVLLIHQFDRRGGQLIRGGSIDLLSWRQDHADGFQFRALGRLFLNTTFVVHLLL